MIADLWPATDVARRRLGRALVAFGGIGLALLLATGILVAITLGGIGDAATGLEQQRTELVAMLDPASTAIRDAANSAQRAGSSLGASAQAARDGASLTGELATSMDQMNALSTLDILGTRPFAGIGPSFSDLATRSRTLSASLTATADALVSNATDSATVGADLGQLADQLDGLRASVGNPSPVATSAALDGLRLLLLALLVWLALPAAASVWLGRRLLRPA